MASYNELNALIDAYINRNGVQAITGQILNGVLKAMVEQLGRGYTIMGAAIPTTDPGTPDGPECYFASETGTYTDFDGLQVAPGELALLCYTPSDGWTKATIYEGFQEVGATIDGNVGTPSVGVSYANGVLSFDFHNMKGNPGQNGQDGAAAGFGTIGADIAGGVGTPGVSVESSGPATAKNLQFHFTNLKGETGVTSVVATVDNTSGNPSCAVSLQGQQLTLAFSGLKGLKGDTGVSADYPITIYNGLDSDATDAALSAAQGKVLDGKVSQLRQEVTGLDEELTGWESGYITDDQGVGEACPKVVTANQSWRHQIVSVQPDLIYKIKGTGDIAPRLWVFLDGEDKILSDSGQNVTSVLDFATLVPPTGATQLIINSKTINPCYVYYKGQEERISAIEPKVDELEQENVYSEAETAIASDSPYYENKLSGYYINPATEKIETANANWILWLFRLPAGKYRFRVTANADSSKGAIFATFANASDFVNNGYPSHIIALGTGVAQEIDEVFEEETLVSFSQFASFTYQGSLSSVAVTTIKEKVEEMDEQMSELSELPSEMKTLSGKVDGLQEKLISTSYVALSKNSPYFVSQLNGCYVENGKIVSYSYSSGYILFLYTIPAGNYRINVLRNTLFGTVVGTLASVEDFVIGGNIETAIVTNPSGASTQTITFKEETNLFVLGRTDTGERWFVDVEQIVTASKLDTMQGQIDGMFTNGLDIVIPDTMYAIVGTELNIWNDAVALSIDKGLQSPLNYQIRWGCEKGTITDRSFRFTPASGDVGNVSCTCRIYDMRGILVGSKTFTIKVLAKNALATAKKIVYFGDSLGANAASALYNNFHDSNRFGGTIPTMLGTRGETKHYEAAGGYKWANYATAGEAGFRISVSGVTSLQIGAVYSDGSHNFEILEVNITEGSGNCLLGQHFSGTLIMPSGTLTKVSGGGDDSVPYTDAFQESANPLWNDTTQELDINQYKQMLVELGQLTSVSDKIDAVSFQFGINDNALANDLSTLHGYIYDLYNLFVGDNANCKFIVGLTTSSGNDVNGSGANYGATYDWKTYLKNTYIIRKFYLSLQTDFPNMRIATPNLYLDRYYGYALGTRQISDRCTETEKYHTNFVHPAPSGYNQMADAYIACYVGVLTES